MLDSPPTPQNKRVRREVPLRLEPPTQREDFNVDKLKSILENGSPLVQGETGSNVILLSNHSASPIELNMTPSPLVGAQIEEYDDQEEVPWKGSTIKVHNGKGFESHETPRSTAEKPEKKKGTVGPNTKSRPVLKKKLDL